MDINIPDYDAPTSLVERNYTNNYPRQVPIYLVIDWETEEITVETRNYQIHGTPSREWHGIVSTFRLPDDVDATCIRDTVEGELMGLINAVHASFETQYNGNNWVGVKDQDAYYELEYAISEKYIFPRFEEGGLWDIGDWFHDLSDADDELMQIKDEHDPRIREIAIRLMSEAESDNVVLDGDIDDIVIMLQNRYWEITDND